MSNNTAWMGLVDLALACGMVAFAAPLVMRKVSRDSWYGLHAAHADESDERWYEVNAYCGMRMIEAACLLALVGVLTLFLPATHVTLRLAGLIACFAIVVPCVEGLQYARSIDAHRAPTKR